jgi:hypothetical protein
MNMFTKTSFFCAVFMLLLFLQAGGSDNEPTFGEQLLMVRAQDQITLEHIEAQIQLRDSTLKSQAKEKQDSLYGSSNIQLSSDTTGQ